MKRVKRGEDANVANLANLANLANVANLKRGRRDPETRAASDYSTPRVRCRYGRFAAIPMFRWR